MKTPKRQYTLPYWHTGKLAPAHPKEQAARWRRKNRIAQLKRTIARLKREKEEAYHRGHQAGYDLCFARS